MYELNNPLKTDKKLNNLKKIVSHCCLLITILSFQYVLLGFFSVALSYQNKSHLIIFGIISSIQLICAPLGYYGIETGNRLYLMILSLVNIIWIICTLLMLTVYWIILDSASFDNEIALHIGTFVFLGASIVLAMSSFLLMRRLNMVSVNLVKPNIKLSPEGKASKH